MYSYNEPSQYSMYTIGSIHLGNNAQFLTREESQPNENLSIYIAKAL